MESSRLYDLEQQLFFLQNELDLLKQQVVAQRVVAGAGIALEHSAAGVTIGNISTQRSGFSGYNADFTIVILTDTLAGDEPKFAIINLSYGINTNIAGRIAWRGEVFGSVARCEMALAQGEIYLRTGLKDGRLDPKFVFHPAGEVVIGGMFGGDNLLLGEIKDVNGNLVAIQAWQSGLRNIDYRWW